MEVALKGFIASKNEDGTYVSILVLMEVALKAVYHCAKECESENVSILVLMEVALKEGF